MHLRPGNREGGVHVASQKSLFGSPRPGRRRPGERRLLIGIQLVTGASALAGGALLTIAPDGSLLQADPSALEGSPFTNWRVPGILLTVLVGGGLVVVACWQWRDGRHARAGSILAGLGLVGFEATELVCIGFQPLEAVFALVGVAIVGLAARQPPPCLKAFLPDTDLGRRTSRATGTARSSPMRPQHRTWSTCCSSRPRSSCSDVGRTADTYRPNCSGWVPGLHRLQRRDLRVLRPRRTAVPGVVLAATGVDPASTS